MLRNTQDLLDLVYEAEDSGKETYIYWFNDDVVDSVEIDGVQYKNDVVDMELDGWENVAEKYWRE